MLAVECMREGGMTEHEIRLEMASSIAGIIRHGVALAADAPPEQPDAIPELLFVPPLQVEM